MSSVFAVGKKPLLFVLVWWSIVVGASIAIANDSVRFDVPVLAEACPLPGDTEKGEQLIEVLIPVTSIVESGDPFEIGEFNFEVFWNRNIYPLVDYGPRTRMQSDIDGTIAVEQHEQNSRNVGLNASAHVEQLARLNGDLGSSQTRSETLRFERIPEQDMLVASGTVQRGTGAFFRFHPSPQFALEGGRELVVTYRVPESWRGGVVRVNCTAHGSRHLFAGFTDPVVVRRSFLVPLYLKGDSHARRIAVEYAQSELELRDRWSRLTPEISASPGPSLLKPFFGSGSRIRLPADWAQVLIESGSDRVWTEHERSLPDSIRTVASNFIHSRRALYQLGR